MHTRRTLIGLMFLAAAAPALALDGPRTNPIQLAQAASVTKFRGFFLGMDRKELDAAAAALGGSVEQETLTYWSEKTGEDKTEIVRNKFKIRKEFIVAKVTFGESSMVEEMTLLTAFFDLKHDISVREFSQKLANAYGVRQMLFERISIPYMGTYWGFRGETAAGERLTVIDYGDGQAGGVDVSKGSKGAF